MNRTFLAAALALSLAACQQDPGGRCGADADCATGQHCSNGLCLSDLRQAAVGEGCYVDKDCVGWADCLQGHCLLAPGACDTTADCQPWQGCNAGHACEMVPGGCANEADCAAWQDCDTATWRCGTAPGRCADAAACSPWQVCDAQHLCVLAPNGCADAGGCAAWQVCTAYRCATAPDRCTADGECQGWETCDLAVHDCVTAANRCTVDAECQEWETCNVASHACVTSTDRCAAETDCQPWEGCGADHRCALDPYACYTSANCAPGYRCNAAHACEQDPCMNLPPACTGTTSGFHTSGQPGSLWEPEMIVPSKFEGSFLTTTSGYLQPDLIENVYISASLPRDPAQPDYFRFWFINHIDGITPGAYAPDNTSSRAQMLIDTHTSLYHSNYCTNGVGTFEVCRIEVGPRFGGDNVHLLEFAGTFSETCDEWPGALSGCVHYVRGSEPGAFGPAEAIAGSGQACAMGGGWIRCWGRFMELEEAPNLMWPLPVFTQLSMGGLHACAVTDFGGVMCWGSNDNYQSGDPGGYDVWEPILVLPAGVSSVHATRRATYAVLTDGRIQFWGYDRLAGGSGGVPTDAFTPGQYVAFAGGDDFTCGVTPGGGIECWGFSDQGQLGDGNIVSYGTRGPVAVAGLASGVQKMSAYGASTCALDAAGAVECWGGNVSGQLGEGTKTVQPSPVAVPLAGPATDVALGVNHACAVVGGGVQCWGANPWGALGDGTDVERLTPTWVSGLGAGSGVVGVAVKSANSCALLQDGTVWCWGDGIGNGDGLFHTSFVPVQVRW